MFGPARRAAASLARGLLRRTPTGAALWALSLEPRAPRHVGRPLGRGVALVGRVWTGTDVFDGCVVVGPDGRVAALGPDLEPAEGVRVLRGGWVGPGVVDAHVHLAFAEPEALLAGGVVGARDLGLLLPLLATWRSYRQLVVAGSGPMLTAEQGYPTRGWGADGRFSAALPDAEVVPRVIGSLARHGVDLIKVALEPAGGPVPTPAQLQAVVRAAHEAGLAVTAHALAADMVARALDAGVDELAHVPTERLPVELVDRIADAGVPVISTLQCHAGVPGRGAIRNAAQLVAAGVPLLYGTDLGNDGTRPGVDPRELDRLADAGLGREGALRAATAGSAGAAGFGGRAGDGTVAVGRPARLVLLDHDPLVEPAAWATPLAVVTGGRLLQP